MTRPAASGRRAAGAAGPTPARTALLNNPYGLSVREVRAEINRCLARGFQLWEIRLRFAPDRTDSEYIE